MEHYRSTLATTACALFGLIAAAHILHPGNYEAQTRPVRPPIAVALQAPAWVDPPATLRVAAAPPDRTADVAVPSGANDFLAPRMVVALQPGETMAPTIPSTIAGQPERGRKAVASHRRKVAQRTARTRQASLDRGPVADQPVANRTAAPETKSKIDPIGDLIRGLGLGGEG